jgi:hypothetical protein
VGEWLVSRHGRFTLEDRAPGTHWIISNVGPTADLDRVGNRKKSVSEVVEPLVQSLHRLSYPGSFNYDDVSSYIVHVYLRMVVYMKDELKGFGKGP